MSLTLFKADLKGNALLWAIIAYAMMIYFSVIAFMFDPTDTTAIASMLELLPEGLMSAFGFDSVSTDLTGFLADYYYGFIVFIIPLIYCIITANKLVVKLVDNGSFSYLLSTARMPAPGKQYSKFTVSVAKASLSPSVPRTRYPTGSLASCQVRKGRTENVPTRNGR